MIDLATPFTDVEESLYLYKLHASLNDLRVGRLIIRSIITKCLCQLAIVKGIYEWGVLSYVV